MEKIVEEKVKLRWIKVSANAPYFEDENGAVWTPIGQNDAITWPDLAGLFKRRDVAAVEGHLAYLAAHGVTCLRLMLEYCQTENRYLERPAGKFQTNMVQFWDDLFVLCEKYGLRILLTPFDTFWMARRWKFHPYNKLSGGPAASKWQWLSSPQMLAAIKNRFTFAIERWSGSGVLFGWDLWNEISPVHAKKDLGAVHFFVDQVSSHIRDLEMKLYGKTHLQTVSVFAPVLQKYDLNDLVFRHPGLDFASTHFYHEKTINYPRNTFDAAVKTGSMIRYSLEQATENRPFLDSENGPIDYFRKRKKGLQENFDDEYFLNMQWAHFASGGAGGGMRWPYRYPHVLTHGMRRAQRNLSRFMALIDWQNFSRQNLNDEIKVNTTDIAHFGCGTERQAIIWLLEHPQKRKVKKSVLKFYLSIPAMTDGSYHLHFWDPVSGEICTSEAVSKNGYLIVEFEMKSGNLAIAVKFIH